jgi:hypothetical protein
MQGDLHRIGSVSVWGVSRLHQSPWCVATRLRSIGGSRIADAAEGRGSRVSCAMDGDTGFTATRRMGAAIGLCQQRFGNSSETKGVGDDPAR